MTKIDCNCKDRVTRQWAVRFRKDIVVELVVAELCQTDALVPPCP
jgi:hypothetical protein